MACLYSGRSDDSNSLGRVGSLTIYVDAYDTAITLMAKNEGELFFTHSMLSRRLPYLFLHRPAASQLPA